MTERRHFSRVPFAAEADLTCGEKVFSCRLLDIALKGALLEIADRDAGSQPESCRLTLRLGNGEEIVMEGRIVHAEGTHFGMECSEIDLESMTSLRRLVELNLGDTALLNREFADLLHFA